MEATGRPFASVAVLGKAQRSLHPIQKIKEQWLQRGELRVRTANLLLRLHKPTAAREVVPATADEFVNAVTCDFQVELDADGLSAVLKHLVWTDICLDKVCRTVRQVEGLAMPVERCKGNGPTRRARRSPGLRPELDRKPADLPFAPGRRRPENAGKELCTETDAKYRFAGLERLVYQRLFMGQPRVFTVIMNAHGTAHDHKPVEVVNGGKPFGPEHIRRRQHVPAQTNPSGKGARPLKRDML